jgi:hypothetical protein
VVIEGMLAAVVIFLLCSTILEVQDQHGPSFLRDGLACAQEEPKLHP